MKKEMKFTILAIILIILFAISISPKSLQNDTFYTVTIGKLISENGIDMEDHFSWHEGLPYTYPHWLYDLGMYFIYKLGGWDGIYISTCIFTAILGICIYLSNSKLSNNNLISFIITIAVMYLLKGYITARAQLVTFIFFILLIYNIEKFIENKKIKNVISILFIHIFIANLHVAVWPFSFILYLPYIAEYFIAEAIDIILYRKIKILFLKNKIKNISKKIDNKKLNDIQKEKAKDKLQVCNTNLEKLELKVEKIKQKRKEEEPYKILIVKKQNVKWLILIMIIAVFTGLLTPLGKVPYTYTYDTIRGNTMKNINEHLPLTLINNTPILCTIIVLLTVLLFTRVKIRLSDLFMLGGLCFMMFNSRRQQSMFVLIGSVSFIRVLTNLVKMNYEKEEFNKKFVNKFTVFALIAIILTLSLHFYKKVKNDSYINKSTYPVEASEWILNNLDTSKIRLFNEYNYGSYLLYKGIPVFIDSRADLYAPEFNAPTKLFKDVKDILVDNSDVGTFYGDVFGKDIFNDFINSSNIGTFYGDVFEKYKVTHVILYKNSKMNMIITKADSEKYKELYSDNKFVIYEVLEY